MSLQDDVRDRIEEQRKKVQRWRELYQVRDDRQDDVADAIDEARDDLAKLRHLREALEKRHEGWTDKELKERRDELTSAIADGLDVIDHLLERLAAVHEMKHKAAEHLAEHKKQLERLEKKLHYLQTHHDPDPAAPTGLIVPYDGKLVAGWIVRDALIPARSAGVQFTVISGYRSPAYSISLCQGICGAPSCPGLCAGAASNHACPPTGTGKEYEGAIDVSPGASSLRAWCSAHGWPIVGGGVMLPSDPNHFSRSGR